MKYELAQMVKQGGDVVVNTSSGAGIRGVARGAFYAASKHAIIGLTARQHSTMPSRIFA